MGFIVNKPSAVRLHQLLTELEIAAVVSDRAVLIGGPVGGTSGFVMYEHARGRPLAPGIEVSESISLSPSRELLAAGARGDLPGRFDLLLGYAGWAPAQLEGELERGAWLHAPFDAELLFDVPAADRWQETYERLGISPDGFMTVPGGAKA